MTIHPTLSPRTALLWGVLVIALDVVIIWAIVAHGHEARDLRWW